MQIVNLMGGLGNQMFQYAFARAYEIKNKCNVRIDLAWFKKVKTCNESVDSRVYELGCFSTKPFFASDEDIKKCFRLKDGKLVRNTIRDRQAGVFQPELLESKNNHYFEGYFQSEKYFKNCRKEILSYFNLNLPLNQQNKEMIEKIKSTNSVSIHVRRGDYVKLQDVHGLCTLDYYKKAIEYIASKIETPHFYVFSDDIVWVEKNLKIDYAYTVVNINDSTSGCFDIELMKNCKHNIIANSSFSWWGAWLNQNAYKIVIAPKRWFTHPELLDDDLIPDDWIKM